MIGYLRPLTAIVALALLTPHGLRAADGNGNTSTLATNMTIERYYAYAGDRRIHYRRAGSGPPLVLLHASPGSSAGLLSLIAELAVGHTVIAFDTPGYGESQALPIDRPEISDYAEALAPMLDALNLTQVDIYGSHTGAKIAMEFSVTHPDRVRRAVIDGIGLYTDAERESRLAHYTPSLAPVWDGSHLTRTWAMRREMLIFSPWYDRSGDARRASQMRSPDELHDMAVDFLRAGSGYWRGYQAAFRYDSEEALAKVTRPTLLVATPGDSLLAHLSRVGKVPDVVRIERLATVAPRMLEYLADNPLPAAPPPPAVPVVEGKVRRDYVATSVGRVLIRKAGSENQQPPLLLLHQSPASSRGLEPLLLEMAKDRLVITLDNPGNGDSPALTGKPTITDVARVVAEVVDNLGLDEYDLYGTHTGALIAMEVALADVDRVRRLILDGVPMFSAAETEEYLARYALPMEVRADGTQLLWAWNFLRDGALWWPWYNRTADGTRLGIGVHAPEVLHEELVEFMKGARTYHLNYQAAFAYPTRVRLPLLGLPVCLCSSDADILAGGMAEAAELAPNNTLISTPGKETATALATTADIYRKFLSTGP